jgi:hypothetical protein
MKNRNCRMTPVERQQHELAVKIRKMTDEQLCEYIDKIYNNAECINKIEVGNAFVIDFINSIKPGSGIGQATIAKLKEYAAESGYIK